jgi:hypothetical protein
MIPVIQKVKAAMDLKAISNVATTAAKPASAAKTTQSVKMADISKVRRNHKPSSLPSFHQHPEDSFKAYKAWWCTATEP